MDEENQNNKEEERKLTPEVEKKLKELRGFTSDEHFFFTPNVYKENLPKDKWPVFKLKGRDGIAIAKSEDDSGYYKTKTDQMYMTTGTSRIDLLRNNILGWKNFKDKKENNISFIKRGTQVDSESLKKISQEMQLQLQEAILSHSQLTSEEVEGLEF